MCAGHSEFNQSGLFCSVCSPLDLVSLIESFHISDHMGLTSLVCLFVLCTSLIYSVSLAVSLPPSHHPCILPLFRIPFCPLLSTFLSEQLSQDVAEMLLVVQREVEEDGSWLNPDDPEKWLLGRGHTLTWHGTFNSWSMGGSTFWKTKTLLEKIIQGMHYKYTTYLLHHHTHTLRKFQREAKTKGFSWNELFLMVPFTVVAD